MQNNANINKMRPNNFNLIPGESAECPKENKPHPNPQDLTTCLVNSGCSDRQLLRKSGFKMVLTPAFPWEQVQGKMTAVISSMAGKSSILWGEKLGKSIEVNHGLFSDVSPKGEAVSPKSYFPGNAEKVHLIPGLDHAGSDLKFGC